MVHLLQRFVSCIYILGSKLEIVNPFSKKERFSYAGKWGPDKGSEEAWVSSPSGREREWRRMRKSLAGCSRSLPGVIRQRCSPGVL